MCIGAENIKNVTLSEVEESRLYKNLPRSFHALTLGQDDILNIFARTRRSSENGADKVISRGDDTGVYIKRK